MKDSTGHDPGWVSSCGVAYWHPPGRPATHSSTTCAGCCSVKRKGEVIYNTCVFFLNSLPKKCIKHGVCISSKQSNNSYPEATVSTRPGQLQVVAYRFDEMRWVTDKIERPFFLRIPIGRLVNYATVPVHGNQPLVGRGLIWRAAADLCRDKYEHIT